MRVLNGAAGEGEFRTNVLAQIRRIGFRLGHKGEGGAKLLERADEHDVDRIAGQAVAGDRVTRHAFMLQDFQAHAERPRQDHSVSGGYRKNPWQAIVGKFEYDKDDQPNGGDPQPEHEQSLQKAFQ
jgi:hypothetical protein